MTRYLGAFLQKVADELEVPRRKRPFGSGWLSGSIAILAGLTSLLMVVALRYPTLLLMPDLGTIRDNGFFRPVLFFILISGFVLSSLSLILRRDMTLGVAAMGLTLLASAIGSFPASDAPHGAGIFFGLDFFVLNVLFMGFRSCRSSGCFRGSENRRCCARNGARTSSIISSRRCSCRS